MSTNSFGESLTNGSIDDLLDVLEYKVKGLEINTTSPGTNIEPASKLHSRVTGLLHRISSVKNANAPVNSMPDVILVLIFKACVTSSRLKFPGFAAVIRLASVCRRWRRVATLNAVLWANINIHGHTPSGLAAAAEYLSRSKEAPLDLSVAFWNTPTKPTAQLMHLLRLHSTRIRTLELYLSESSNILNLEPWLDLPKVQNLTISGQGHISAGSRLPCMFHPGPPLLRHIYMIGYSSWQPGMFVNLTSLSLACSGAIIGLPEFLSMLNDSPMLEELQVDQHGPSNTLENESFAAGEPTCKLLHLSKVELIHGFPRFILEHIQVPPNADITIRNHLDHRHDFDQLCQAIPRNLDRLGLEVPELVDIVIGRPGDLIVLALRGPRFSDTGLEILQDKKAHSVRSDEDLLTRVLRSLANITGPFFHHTQSLSIGFSPACDNDWRLENETSDDEDQVQDIRATADEWGRALQEFPNLVDLTINDCLSQQLLDALAPPANGADIRLPHLRSLHLSLYAPVEKEESIETLLYECIRLVRSRNDARNPIRDFDVYLWCNAKLNDKQCDFSPGVEGALLALEGNGVEKITFRNVGHDYSMI